jgi:hypothetical protein
MQYSSIRLIAPIVSAGRQVLHFSNGVQGDSALRSLARQDSHEIYFHSRAN